MELGDGLLCFHLRVGGLGLLFHGIPDEVKLLFQHGSDAVSLVQ